MDDERAVDPAVDLHAGHLMGLRRYFGPRQQTSWNRRRSEVDPDLLVIGQVEEETLCGELEIGLKPTRTQVEEADLVGVLVGSPDTQYRLGALHGERQHTMSPVPQPLTSDSVTLDAHAEAIFRDYLSNPHSYWEGASVRQAEKLLGHLSNWINRLGGQPDEVADHLLSQARRRRPNSPVYVTGLGGSGSHWLAGMLGETGHFFDAGEVYFPPAFANALDTDPEAPMLVDALHLLHRSHHPVEGDARAVNSSAGASWTGRRLAWDPAATVVYLIRDPRDQVLSTTFRKAEYRAFVAEDAPDGSYLLHRCRLNRSDRQQFMRGGVAADITVRYEDLRSDAERSLLKIMAAAGESVSEAAIRAAVNRHDARRIAHGDEEHAGNLNLEAGLTTWRDQPSKWVTAIHAELADVIEDLAYPFGECLGPPVGRVTNAPEEARGVRLRGWTSEGWSTGAAQGPWLAEMRYFDPSQIDWLSAAPIVALCAVRMRTVEDNWLSSVLDNPGLTSLDLGTVELSPHQFELLGTNGNRLAALGLWRSGPVAEIENLRHQLPLTTVFG